MTARKSDLPRPFRAPVGAEGSGLARYAGAMSLYRDGRMSAELLEIFRRCVMQDDEDPLALARFEGIAVPDELQAPGASSGPSA